MRNRIIIGVIVLLIIIYWRGIGAVQAKDGITCQYHLAYAMCVKNNNKAHLPTLLEVMQAGIKF